MKKPAFKAGFFLRLLHGSPRRATGEGPLSLNPSVVPEVGVTKLRESRRLGECP